MLFCCLWRNVKTSCHKHFAVFYRYQQTPPLILSASYWQHSARSSVKSTHWSQILGQNRDFCLPHLHLTPPLGGFPSEYRHAVWYGKTRTVWLLDDEKNLMLCLFVLTEFTNMTDRQTHRQTDRQTDTAWRHRLRLHSIALQKAVETKGQFVATQLDSTQLDVELSWVVSL